MLFLVRTDNNREKRDPTAIVMMGFFDSLIAGLAIDLILNLLYFVFLSDPLLRKKSLILKKKTIMSRLLFGTQYAVEGLLETLEEACRS